MRRPADVDDKMHRHPKPDPARPGTCRWCRQPVTDSRRKTWCSKACVDEYRSHSANGQRRSVFKRDLGICAGCGRDCEALFNKVRLRIQRHDPGATALRRILLLLHLQLTSWYWPRSFWEVDHILPVSEGGGGACGLTNLRTLCVPCHRKATEALRERRWARRRKAAV